MYLYNNYQQLLAPVPQVGQYMNQERVIQEMHKLFSFKHCPPFMTIKECRNFPFFGLQSLRAIYHAIY